MRDNSVLQEILLKKLELFGEEPNAQFVGRLKKEKNTLGVVEIESVLHEGNVDIHLNVTKSGIVPVGRKYWRQHEEHVGQWVICSFFVEEHWEKENVRARIERVLSQDELTEIRHRRSYLFEMEEREKNLKKETEFLEEKLSQNRTAFNQVKKETDGLIKTLGELSTKKKDIEEEIKILQKFGLFNDDCILTLKDGDEESEGFNDQSLNGALKNIFGFLAQKSGIYSEEFIRTFSALMCTHDIVILAGRSGTGKTSFCRLFADAIGAELTVIPVKPNWLSSEELLGYFNPVTGKYYSTPFLNAIEKANIDPTRLHLVVLDEMNIARPEYYFADLLSCLENRSGSEVYIDLPTADLHSTSKVDLKALSKLFLSSCDNALEAEPKKILSNKSIREKLSVYFGCEDKEIEEYLLGLSLDNQIARAIPSSVKIPNNIRFIGTINIDETTHFFSPKVLDRVHILKLDDPLSVPEDRRCHGSAVKSTIHPRSFGSRKTYPAYDSKNTLAQLLLSITDECRKIGADVSLRVVRQSMLFEEEAIKLGLSHKEVAGYVIRSKIFPRLVFDAADAYGQIRYTKKKALEEIKSKIRDQVSQECLDELDKLIAQAEGEDHQVNYWSL